MGYFAEAVRSPVRYQKAMEILHDLKALSLETLGEKHQDRINVMAHQSIVYRNYWGYYRDAELLQLNALDLIKDVPGKHHLSATKCTENVAKVWANQGRYKELCCS